MATTAGMPISARRGPGALRMPSSALVESSAGPALPHHGSTTTRAPLTRPFCAAPPSPGPRPPPGLRTRVRGVPTAPTAGACEVQDVVAVTPLLAQPLERHLPFGVQVGGRDVAEAPLDTCLLGLHVDRRELAAAEPRRPT